MKERTKKRLRLLLFRPLWWVWVGMALIIAVFGTLLCVLSLTMIGDSARAKYELKKIF